MSAELLLGIKIPTFFFLWTTPVWLAWYLLAAKIMGMRPGRIEAQAAEAQESVA
jgi:hypothetical protein